MLFAGVIVAAGTVVSAHAQGMEPAGMGHGGMGHGGMGGMAMFGGPPAHAARFADRMLDGLDATEAQRAQVRQIVQAAATDLRAQHEAGAGLRRSALQLFSAPTVDAAAAESLRQQMLAQHDQASKRMLQAMLEIGKVLTPQQRARIGERMKAREAVMHDRMQREHEHHEHPTQPAR
jgi:Spy/CpxP family protein refolding chaperone